MPVQIWTPTAPNADSAALGLGIAGAGKSLGRALEKIGEEHKRNATQAKAVETFLSTLPEDQLPMDLQAFKNLSAKEKIGVGMGLLQGQQFRNGQQEGQVNLARLAEINQRMQTQQAETANAAKSPAFLSALSRYRQPTLEAMPAGVEGPPNQMPGLDALSAAGRASEETGFQVPPTALARILDEIGQSEGAAAGPLSFEEDPATGTRFARTGKSVLPSGVNPAMQSREAEELFDPEGNVIGHRVPIGGGKFTFKPAKAEASGKLQPVLDPTTGEPVPGMGMDATGKVHDFRSTIEKATGRRIDTAPPKGSGKVRKWNPATGKLE